MPGARKRKIDAAGSPGGTDPKNPLSDVISSPVSKRTRSRITKKVPETIESKSTTIDSKSTTAPLPTKSAGKFRNQRKIVKSDRASVVKKSGTKSGSRTSTATMYMPMEVDEGPARLPIPSKPAAAPSSGEEENNCAVCMSPIENPKKLDKCGHEFCTECIDQCFAKMNPVCPICGMVYGDMTGNMPPGAMTVCYDTQTQLEGYHGCGIIIIEYNFPNGRQTHEHPHPGRQYYGTHRVAYLPNNEEGKKVYALLRRSFEARMTFTVGRSATTGLEDQVIWNDVHHKTRIHGGPTAFGYPDPTYLSRVQEELACKGIK